MSELEVTQDGAVLTVLFNRPEARNAMTFAMYEGLEEACARVLDTVGTAPDQLRQDPLGLLVEIDEIARTAPAELSGELTDLRDAVEGFRQGDESLISVVRKARDLQERCSA